MTKSVSAKIKKQWPLAVIGLLAVAGTILYVGWQASAQEVINNRFGFEIRQTDAELLISVSTENEKAHDRIRSVEFVVTEAYDQGDPFRSCKSDIDKMNYPWQSPNKLVSQGTDESSGRFVSTYSIENDDVVFWPRSAAVGRYSEVWGKDLEQVICVEVGHTSSSNPQAPAEGWTYSNITPLPQQYLVNLVNPDTEITVEKKRLGSCFQFAK